MVDAAAATLRRPGQLWRQLALLACGQRVATALWQHRVSELSECGASVLTGRLCYSGGGAPASARGDAGPIAWLGCGGIGKCEYAGEAKHVETASQERARRDEERCADLCGAVMGLDEFADAFG